MIKRALISVYKKDKIFELASFLNSIGTQIISTGGTFKYLKEKGIPVVEVSDVTGFEEILEGRVKTLHPKIYGGILAVRDNKEHMNTIKEKKIEPIDMVVVNLYPFFEKVKDDISFDEKIEFIDIGGPTMIRAAAKNFRDVLVLTDVSDYDDVINQLKEKGDVDFQTRRKLAGKVFNLTSAYDSAVANFLLEENYPQYLSLSYKKEMDLRYGENPHQSAAYYVSTTDKGSIRDFEKLNGKELSYNNIKDMDVAWKVVNEFDEICCCAVKHNTPCGVAIGDSVVDAYKKAFECDSISIFGGIVAFNRKVDADTAKELVKIFLEIVIAPDYDEDAIKILCEKKNLRVIKCSIKPCQKYEVCSVDGGILVQNTDDVLIDKMECVTQIKPDEKYYDDMIFGMKVVKYVKSNGIVVVKDKMAVGIAGGQVNRIWAAKQALERGKGGRVLASDAFFPFSDVVEEASRFGIKVIVQPGGSINDNLSIKACDEKGIAMVFTGVRHFKH